MAGLLFSRHHLDHFEQLRDVRIYSASNSMDWAAYEIGGLDGRDWHLHFGSSPESVQGWKKVLSRGAVFYRRCSVAWSLELSLRVCGGGAPGANTRQSALVEKHAFWLTWALRHGVKQLNLPADELGFITVDAVTHLRRGLNADQVEDIVRNDKRRFEIKVVNGVRLIRAAQGHSKGLLREDIHEKADIDGLTLKHATYVHFLDGIQQFGLCPQGRQHTHFIAADSGEDHRMLSDDLILNDIHIWRSVNNNCLVARPIPFALLKKITFHPDEGAPVVLFEDGIEVSEIPWNPLESLMWSLRLSLSLGPR